MQPSSGRASLLLEYNDVAALKPPTGSMKCPGIIQGKDTHAVRPQVAKRRFEREFSKLVKNVAPSLLGIARQRSRLDLGRRLCHEESQVVSVYNVWAKTFLAHTHRELE